MAVNREFHVKGSAGPWADRRQTDGKVAERTDRRADRRKGSRTDGCSIAQCVFEILRDVSNGMLYV